MATGIETRHARSCRAPSGGRCSCEPTYRAVVRDATGKRIRYPAKTEAEAKAWMRDAKIALRRGQGVKGKTADTLAEVVAAWLEGARGGAIRTNAGDVYKPAAVRGYEQALRLRVLPVLGEEPIADIRRADLQDVVDELIGDGLAASTVQMTIVPLKAIFRREVSRGRLAANPTLALDLPAVRSKDVEVRGPVEAARLLAALAENDRAVWATAMYAGLRRGELMALRVSDVDLKANAVRVARGWDAIEGEQETKSRKARTVPVLDPLRKELVAYLMRSGRRDGDLLFGVSETEPLNGRKLANRADEAWEAAGLERITLHTCRHIFASVMIASGVNGKSLQGYLGHASITTTFDTYGHLMPGHEGEAAALANAYLARALEGGA